MLNYKPERSAKQPNLGIFREEEREREKGGIKPTRLLKHEKHVAKRFKVFRGHSTAQPGPSANFKLNFKV